MFCAACGRMNIEFAENCHACGRQLSARRASVFDFDETLKQVKAAAELVHRTTASRAPTFPTTVASVASAASAAARKAEAAAATATRKAMSQKAGAQAATVAKGNPLRGCAVFFVIAFVWFVSTQGFGPVKSFITTIANEIRARSATTEPAPDATPATEGVPSTAEPAVASGEVINGFDLYHFQFYVEAGEDGIQQIRAGQAVTGVAEMKGFEVSPEGNLDLTVNMAFRDPNGVLLEPVDSDTLQQQAQSDTLYSNFEYWVPAFAPPGNYDLELGIEDRVSGRSAVFHRTIVVEPGPEVERKGTFEILGVSLAGTPLGEPFEGNVVFPGGTTVFYRVRVDGASVDENGRTNLTLSHEVNDPAGAVMLWHGDISSVTEVFYRPEGYWVEITGVFSVPEGTAGGEYTQTMRVTDNTKNQTVSTSIPLNVQ